MKNTELLYLCDTFLFVETATILETWENEFWTYILLDRTIFYPQGWGQPSDRGNMTSWENSFEVQKCMLDPNGVVYHYGAYTSWTFSVWENITLKINSEYRLSNAKNHSAWHFVDVAMNILGYDTSLKAGKGFHFPEGSYVEYTGELPEDIEIMKEKLSGQFQELSKKDIPITVRYDWLSELSAPTGKSPRWVEFEWYVGCGCGGTHVKSSSEIWEVTIRKMKYKKGVLRVSYEVRNL